MKKDTLHIPQLRTFPRWLPPTTIRGAFIPLKETDRAEYAWGEFLTGNHSAQIETAIAQDPDIAIKFIRHPKPINPTLIETAILRKPLLIPELAKAQWANKKHCSENLGSHPELVWTFHSVFRALPADDHIDAFKNSPHYAWKAARQVTWKNPAHLETLKNVYHQHPLYALASLPTPQARADWLNQPAADFATVLVRLLCQTTTRNKPPRALQPVLQEAAQQHHLTDPEKEMLCWLATTEWGNEDATRATQDLLLSLFAEEAQWLYHLQRDRTPYKAALFEELLNSRDPAALGWAMQSVAEASLKELLPLLKLIAPKCADAAIDREFRRLLSFLIGTHQICLSPNPG